MNDGYKKVSEICDINLTKHADPLCNWNHSSLPFYHTTSHQVLSLLAFIQEFSSPLLIPQSIPGSSRVCIHPLKVSFPAVLSPCVSDFYNHMNIQTKVWGTLPHLSLKLESTKLLLVFVLCCCERSLLRGCWGLMDVRSSCSFASSSPQLFRLYSCVDPSPEYCLFSDEAVTRTWRNNGKVLLTILSFYCLLFWDANFKNSKI